MKKLISTIILVLTLTNLCLAAPAQPELSAPSAVLMERDTGKILFEKDAHKKLPPASVTKVMTLLLVFESLDSGKLSLDDKVTASEYAAGMGGSQVFLSPGEQMSVNDMLKATFISSGNDSAVALAEHLAGSEAAFVEQMNARAKELGMIDTVFKNCTGLDEEGHVTSAHDIAVMSRELIKHKGIRDYTTTWIDSLRNGAFQLANTNKLIRTYKGITGLKTGSTSVAKYCLSATAERDGMELVAAILAAPSSKDRFADAGKLLDFGFANYALYNGANDIDLPNLPVTLGEKDFATLDFGTSAATVLSKSELSGITQTTELPESIKAPVAKGQKIGLVKIFSAENLILEIPIISKEAVKKLSVGGIFLKLASKLFMF